MISAPPPFPRLEEAEPGPALGVEGGVEGGGGAKAVLDVLPKDTFFRDVSP